MLFLYWPPWSWKSTIWKKISECLHIDYIDTDKFIESKHWKISDIIQRYGINYFREIETQALLEIVNSQHIDNSVISLGWWALLRRENLWIIQIMKWNIVTLLWDAETLYKNIASDTKNKRPLIANKEDFIRLMLERRNHYEGFEKKVSIHKKDIRLIVREILDLVSISSLAPQSP
jgi:shikimate kinase